MIREWMANKGEPGKGESQKREMQLLFSHEGSVQGIIFYGMRQDGTKSKYGNKYNFGDMNSNETTPSDERR